jgi:poly-gamma-glutamate synthesis protein (capsule biosynthesis protein)
MSDGFKELFQFVLKSQKDRSMMLKGAKNRTRFPVIFLLAIFAASLISCTKEQSPDSASLSKEQPLAPTMTIAFAGDTGIGFRMGADIVQTKGDHAPFEHVRKTLQQADFVVANMEVTMAKADAVSKNKNPSKRPPFRQDPKFAAVYAKEGFTAFGLANNHLMDYLAPGLRTTIESLENAGIKTFGAGQNRNQANAPLVLEKDGIRIAVYNRVQGFKNTKPFRATKEKPGVAVFNRKRFKKLLRQEADKADHSVLFIHWGNIYKPVTKTQNRIAENAIDGGVDLIIGHHPHFPQKVERVQNKPVLYSISNFVFHGVRSGGKTKPSKYDYSIIALVTFSKTKITKIRLVPFFNHNPTTGFAPQPVTQEQAEKLFARILKPLNGNWKLNGTEAIIE